MSDADPNVRRLIRAKRAMKSASSHLRGTPLDHFREALSAMRSIAETEIQTIQAKGKDMADE